MVKPEIQLPPVPHHLAKDPVFYRWLQDLVRMFSADGGIAGDQIVLSGKSLSDLGNKDHELLDNILAVAGSIGGSADRHVSNDDWQQVLTLITDLANAQANLTALEGRVATLETDLTALETRVTNIETEQATQNATLTDHENRLTAGGL